jgi:hypothetical protein
MFLRALTCLLAPLVLSPISTSAQTSVVRDAQGLLLLNQPWPRERLGKGQRPWTGRFESMCRRFFVALALALRSVAPLDAQVAVKDPQSVTILTQAVNAAEGTQAGSISDFVATGSITYFWAGEQVPGSATVKGRAPDQFRLDANLAAGTRSYVVSRGVGALKDTDGTLTNLPLHNTINIGVLSFPYLTIAAALSDPGVAFSYVGLVDNGDGRQVYQIQARRLFSSAADPAGVVAALTVTDYFVDPQTNLLVRTLDMTHPNETFTISVSHEITLDNYASSGGVNVPMLVREKVSGQTIWELRLSGISFNTGLTDAAFSIQ